MGIKGDKKATSDQARLARLTLEGNSGNEEDIQFMIKTVSLQAGNDAFLKIVIFASRERSPHTDMMTHVTLLFWTSLVSAFSVNRNFESIRRGQMANKRTKAGVRAWDGAARVRVPRCPTHLG